MAFPQYNSLKRRKGCVFSGVLRCVCHSFHLRYLERETLQQMLFFKGPSIYDKVQYNAILKTLLQYDVNLIKKI